ncbi:hypothetical protein ACRE_035040 [Hapsidospora chrysogenum ATCC 11550]|uniref:Uncharacterized protein n=1 Tax=Hapsidospora chrysogenum (strain ATCC 11550 / CBS 779.69 / DSM 880 / IAM 14645 / JCM 23072 / IMI 49137) TaxID=857340 RepID=A0A086T8D0_HAPC1|nr:hypothetical protein ACRE_035040 [Hapsidospora chrysogenum ATCC 11550]
MCNRMRELCFTIAMFDNSAFYIMLAEAAIWDVGRCQRPLLEENPLSVNYYTAALRSVSGQIQALRSAVCYGIISTVIAIASYDVRFT